MINPALLAGGASAGLFCDYDGTLSEIVADPGVAHTVPGAVDTLERLTRALTTVVVVSGRPVEFLERELGTTGATLVGLTGLEWSENGVRSVHKQAGSWREVVADVAGSQVPRGVLLEAKDLSLTAHYRSDPSRAEAAREWAERQAARSGLRLRPARMSIELHPPIDIDKGTVVAGRAGGLAAVLYVGDDDADIRAFDVLDKLEQRGADVTRMAVRSSEAPPELLDRADVIFDGPAAVVVALEGLCQLVTSS